MLSIIHSLPFSFSIYSTEDALDDVNKAIDNQKKSIDTRTYSYNSCYHYMDLGNDGYLVTFFHNGLSSNGTDIQCPTSIAEPHAGDGNKRLSSGYKWMPTFVYASFVTGIATGKNRTYLSFRFGPTLQNLNNLKRDSNETLEMEVHFYNYYNSQYCDKGTAYQFPTGRSYSTNIPDAYPDTTVCDNGYDVSLCIGCHDATKLSTNNTYMWTIDSDAGTQSHNYPQDGRFRIVAQRGYHTSNTVSTWNVYAEEHEHDVRLGITSSNNWIPNPYNAWYYAVQGTGFAYYDGDVYSHAD